MRGLSSTASSRAGWEPRAISSSTAARCRSTIADRRARYRATIKARIDWEPDEPNYHLFAIDVDSAGFVIFGKGGYGLAWSPADGLRRWEQT